MRNISNKNKNKLLALLLATTMSASIAALSACTGNDDSSSSTPDSSSGSSILDTGLIQNASFNKDYKGDENLNLIGTSVASWGSVVVGSSKNGSSADTSSAKSGVVDTSSANWEDLTLSKQKADFDFSALSEADAAAKWKNDEFSSRDKIAYYEAWKAKSENKDKNIADLDFYQAFNTTKVEQLPACENPRTHDYQEGVAQTDSNVLMIHNAYSSTGKSTLGTAQKITSSSTVTVPMGASAQFSVWVKTADLQFGNAQTAPSKNGLGAYINIAQSVGGNSLDVWSVKNINTAAVADNDTNGWLQYTFYLQGSSFADSTFTMELGLGQGGKGDYTEYVNGYAFFDDIECEIITNKAYADATSAAGFANKLDFTDKGDDKVYNATNAASEQFAISFYGNEFKDDVYTPLQDSISYKYTTETGNLTTYTAVDDGTNTLIPSLNFSKDGNKFQVYNNVADMENDTVTHVATAYKAHIKNSKLFTAENKVLGNDKSVLILASGSGAPIQANASTVFTVAKDKYLAVSFFVKTSNMNGITGATVTLINGENKQTITGIDTTTASPVDIGNEKDVYDGWQRCFFFVKNETETDNLTFTLQFNFGPTTLLDKTKANFINGFAMFAGFKTHAMTEEEFACAEGGTYSKVVSLVDGTTKVENGNSMDSVAATADPRKDIEQTFGEPKTYQGVYGNSTLVGGSINDTNMTADEKLNLNAGLLNQQYAEAYENNGLLAKFGATGATANEKWASVFGTPSGLQTEIANQPLVIFNDGLNRSYGYIGSTTSVGANATDPTVVSFRVKASAGAKAYIYLIDTDDTSYASSLSVGTKLTYWYDKDGNVCDIDPTDDSFDKSHIAFYRKTNGLYLVNPAWNTAKNANLSTEQYYANLLAYDTVKDGNLMVAEGGVSYDYTDDFSAYGNNGVAFYNYNESEKTAYTAKQNGLSVKDFSLVTALPARMQQNESKALMQVVDGGTSGSGWVNVSFYIKSGAVAKNYRVELFSGSRDGSKTDEKGFVNDANTYVIFDTNGNNSINATAYTTLITDRKEKVDESAYFEGVFSFFDSAKFLRYDATLDTNGVGNSYDDYNSNDEKYAKDIAYLFYEDAGNKEIYVNYAVTDVTVAADVEESDDSSSNSTSATTPTDTNPWLLASSIAIAVVLVLAIVSIIVRKAIVSARKKRTSNDK